MIRALIVALSFGVVLVGCEQPADTTFRHRTTQYSLGYLLPELALFNFALVSSDVFMGCALKTSHWHDSVDHTYSVQDQVFAARNELGDTYSLDSGLISVNDSSVGMDVTRPFNTARYLLPFPGMHRWSVLPGAMRSPFSDSVAAPAPPRILSPSMDSAIDLSRPITIAYDAPGADSVHIRILAFLEPKDTANDDFRLIDDQFDVPNTGSLRYVAPNLPDFEFQGFVRVGICVLDQRFRMLDNTSYVMLSTAIDEVSWDLDR